MTEKKKLTVRVDTRWLEAAKEFAEENDTSLSSLISEFLRALVNGESRKNGAPIMNELSGILPSDVSVKEHREHLNKKYGR